MKMNFSALKIPAAMLMALILSIALLIASSAALAATAHNIALIAKTLPNGQVGYALGDTEAAIPGPTLFIKEDDAIEVTLTNDTGMPVSFKVPGLGNQNPAVILPNDSANYSITAIPAGSYVYHGNSNGKELLGLFGALIVDKADGAAERYVDENGVLTAVNQNNLDKQIVLFMVGSTFWGTGISASGSQTSLWANPTLGAVEDEIVRFHILSLGPAHTFHLHAHRWLKAGTNEVIDTKLLADGSDTHTFTIKAGTGVGAGHWQFHCHLISHMEAGMHGNFHVVENGSGASIAGASPYGRILLGPKDEPGLVTFEVSDEPASWFRSARGDAIVGLGLDIKTKSLEVIAPGSSVNFVMSDTNGVHTISTLLWPSGAEHMPFDQTSAYRGGAIVKLTTPGLYVFTCKIHPYMFGAVIVDSDQTTQLTGVASGLDLGNPATEYSIDLVTGIKNLPTSSDLAVRLLKTFFVATSPDNWQDYSSGVWNVRFPVLPVNITGATVKLSDILNVDNMPLPALSKPNVPGIGEVWVNTQFEKTAHKTKPGTITVVDTANWAVKRKIALPGINMNNPHNMCGQPGSIGCLSNTMV